MQRLPERPIDQHPLVREKQAECERAGLDLARTTIRAPLDGTAVNVRLQKGEQIKAEIDDLLDEIDEVLDANAEDFVRSYVQKGGE